MTHYPLTIHRKSISVNFRLCIPIDIPNNFLHNYKFDLDHQGETFFLDLLKKPYKQLELVSQDRDIQTHEKHFHTLFSRVWISW